MKNIKVSNNIWKQLRVLRNNLGFKHYSPVIQWLFEHQSLPDITNDEIPRIKSRPVQVPEKQVSLLEGKINGIPTAEDRSLQSPFFPEKGNENTECDYDKKPLQNLEENIDIDPLQNLHERIDEAYKQLCILKGEYQNDRDEDQEPICNVTLEELSERVREVENHVIDFIQGKGYSSFIGHCHKCNHAFEIALTGFPAALLCPECGYVFALTIRERLRLD